MNCLRTALLVATATTLSWQVTDLSAHPSKTRRHVVVRPSPSDDAIGLAGLAPMSRRSTVEQSYGDAEFARSRFQRRAPAEEREDQIQAATVGIPYLCDPRSAKADAYACRNPNGTGYGQGYAFTPSYVSAPQNFGGDPDIQTSVLPDVTAFFWAANGLRFDPH